MITNFTKHINKNSRCLLKSALYFKVVKQLNFSPRTTYYMWQPRWCLKKKHLNYNCVGGEENTTGEAVVFTFFCHLKLLPNYKFWSFWTAFFCSLSNLTNGSDSHTVIFWYDIATWWLQKIVAKFNQGEAHTTAQFWN